MKNSMSKSYLGVLFLLLGVVAHAGGSPRRLAAELDVDLAIEEVWELWSTEAGLTSFLAPKAVIEPQVGGLLEVHFFPGEAPGSRGGENLRILAFEPPRRLLFTWSAPPAMPQVRAQRSVVEIRLESLGQSRTRLFFSHFAWGTGEEWDRAFDYFDQAWRAHVLPHFLYRVSHGPLDWSAPPRDLLPVAPTLKSGESSSALR